MILQADLHNNFILLRSMSLRPILNGKLRSELCILQLYAIYIWWTDNS